MGFWAGPHRLAVPRLPAPPDLGRIAHEANAGALGKLWRMSGRSYWMARYRDRERPIYEWDLDWTELPRAGMTELHLIAPTAQAYALQVPPGKTGACFFQLKGATAMAGAGSRTNYHLIGRVDNDESGACSLAVWDYDREQLFLLQSNLDRLGAELGILIQRPNLPLIARYT